MSRYKVALTVQDNAPSFFGVFDMANKSQGFNGMLLSRGQADGRLTYETNARRTRRSK